jgi:hypothetical protein
LWVKAPSSFAQDVHPPVLVFNAISIQLDGKGIHRLSEAEIARIAAGSGDESGIISMTVAPNEFGFCDVGQQTVTLTLIDAFGNSTNSSGPIQVLAPVERARSVYVDASYAPHCARVGFPNTSPKLDHFVGFDAFNGIQAAVDHVEQNGVLYIAAGTYAENVIITKPMCLVGPNAGTIGASMVRVEEARVIPQHSDPENAPILSVESDDVIIDGLFLDGCNPRLLGGYDANGVRVHAAAGVQNGSYPDLADVEGITIRNTIITNISYDGICLDRYQYFGTSSAWNYIRNNKLSNMWEGILTYAVDSIIDNNVISNVTHGLGVHCVTTAAPKGFVPLVASNVLTIAQWWPVEIQVARAPGIWINFRRERASPIEVVGNVINTPRAAPSLKTIIGLYALTVDGKGKISFIDNTIEGDGNCNVGMLAANCWSNNSVKLVRGSLRKIRGTGVLADTLDPRWGAGNCFLSISNVQIALTSSGTGVTAMQEAATVSNKVLVEVIGETSISGGVCGVQVSGTNAAAIIKGTAQQIQDNDIGVYVSQGRALLEGNYLASNRVAAVMVEANAIVDAGDCAGGNVTGLNEGTGLNGASAGLNDFSGYGFDKLPPWAINNSGSVPVLADRNFFNAGTNERIEDSIKGAVRFSDSAILNVRAPPPVQVQCLLELPSAAATFDEFIAAGGLIEGGTAATISSHDTVVTNRPGQYTVTRTYSIGGGCNQGVTCNQIISAWDNQGPTLNCSANIVQGVDEGRDYATVTFTNLAADSCGELLGTWVPVSTAQFFVGTNTVIVVATDAANNSTACSFDVAVIAPLVITLQPVSRTNNSGTTASFKVGAQSAAPMTFQWKKDGVALSEGGRFAGVSSANLYIAGVMQSDEGNYSVEVGNLAGSIASANARLTVVTPKGNLRVIGFSEGVVTLQLSGPVGREFRILTSTNFAEWLPLFTNPAPCTFAHTNQLRPAFNFYRATPQF